MSPSSERSLADFIGGCRWSDLPGEVQGQGALLPARQPGGDARGHADEDRPDRRHLRRRDVARQRRDGPGDWPRHVGDRRGLRQRGGRQRHRHRRLRRLHLRPSRCTALSGGAGPGRDPAGVGGGVHVRTGRAATRPRSGPAAACTIARSVPRREAFAPAARGGRWPAPPLRPTSWSCLPSRRCRRSGSRSTTHPTCPCSATSRHRRWSSTASASAP